MNPGSSQLRFLVPSPLAGSDAVRKEFGYTPQCFVAEHRLDEVFLAAKHSRNVTLRMATLTD